MAKTIASLKQEYQSFMKGIKPAYMSTVEDRQPRVRPVAVLWHENIAWIGSGTSNGKTQQVRRNENVELCIPIEGDGRNGYVRLSGKAEIVTDANVRSDLARKMPFFDTYWEGPDDADYSLIRITPSEIVYMGPGDDHHHTIYL